MSSEPKKESNENKEVNFGVASVDRRDGAEGVAKGPNGGVIATEVARFSSCAKAGLQVGDEIMAINGKGVSSMDAINSAVAAAGIGSTVNLAVTRNAEKMEIKVRLFAKKSLKNFKVKKADVVLERKIAP